MHFCRPLRSNPRPHGGGRCDITTRPNYEPLKWFNQLCDFSYFNKWFKVCDFSKYRGIKDILDQLKFAGDWIVSSYMKCQRVSIIKMAVQPGQTIKCRVNAVRI